MKTKQQIKEQIDIFEVNEAEREEIAEYCKELNETELYLFIVELEYRGIIYDCNNYPVVPDRYDCIWDKLCDEKVENITTLKKYLEESCESIRL